MTRPLKFHTELAAIAAASSLRLRLRAEMTLKAQTQRSATEAAADAGLSPEAVLKTLFELRVHQIELEMQNEELRRVQLQLDAERERYFDLYDLAPVGYVTVSETGLILQANLTAATLLGVVRTALSQRPLSRFIYQPDQDRYYQLRQQLLRTGEQQACELRMLKHEGALFWAQIEASAVHDESGKPLLRVVLSDISARKQSDEKRQLLANVFTHAREGIFITTSDGTITDVNEAFCRISGYRPEQVLGQNPRILKSGRQNDEFYAKMWRGLIEHGHWSGEIWNRHQSGELFAEVLTISAVGDEQGQTRHYVALFIDITLLKAHQRRLEHIAHYDDLTGLPNRVLLADRLQQAMTQAQRRTEPLAVAYLDLDGFKAINDQYGHATGDQMLVALAAQMKQVLREGDTLARLGGDEFVAVLPDVSNLSTSLPMLTRLLAAAGQAVQVGERLLQVTASLGVTFYPQNEEIDADQLLRQADQAMYQAKQAGKNRYSFYDAEHARSLRGHHASLTRIAQALAEHELVLFYQPKVNMRSGAVIGVEALIRWQHPQQGLLPPAQFLPVIEDQPLAIELGEWVIEAALTQLDRWRAQGLALPVSVNIGARQLQRPDFVERVRALLAAHPGTCPGELEMEVLETSALQDLAHVSQVIKDCSGLGVAFALDDFGTGYSSLTYLKRLPVAQLKIDQSFVRDMLADPNDLAILIGVIGLAKAFGRKVLAEGVETPAHSARLLQLGCELGQGYGIARPMPAQQVPDWLRLRAGAAGSAAVPSAPDSP